MIAGIVPERKGALAFLNDEGALVAVQAMPAQLTGHPDREHGEIDMAALVNLLTSYSLDYAVIHRTRAKPENNATEAFWVGVSYGTIAAVLAGLGIPKRLRTGSFSELNVERGKCLWPAYADEFSGPGGRSKAAAAMLAHYDQHSATTKATLQQAAA